MPWLCHNSYRLHRNIYGCNPLESPITPNAIGPSENASILDPLIASVLANRSQSRWFVSVKHLPHRLRWNLKMFWAQLQAVQDRGSSSSVKYVPFWRVIASASSIFVLIHLSQIGSNVSICCRFQIGLILKLWSVRFVPSPRRAVFYLRLQVNPTPTRR